MNDTPLSDEASPLTESDVRAMVRLIGEVAAMSGGHAEKKRRLLDGLCEIIDAQLWQWSMGLGLEPGSKPVFTCNLHGGFDAETLSAHMLAMEHPGMAELCLPFHLKLAQQRRHLTGNEIQLDPRRLLKTGEIGEVFKRSGVGTRIISYRPLEDGMTSCIGLFRRTGRPEFGARETRITHIVLTEVPWLHERGWPEDKSVVQAPYLPPRQITILNQLLEGIGRKQIASNLNLTENSVNGYVKDVYRHYGVNSQSQLLRKFTAGDGGDRA